MKMAGQSTSNRRGWWCWIRKLAPAGPDPAPIGPIPYPTPGGVIHPGFRVGSYTWGCRVGSY